MLVCRGDEETDLQLPEQRHAEELYTLADTNRTGLREWLGFTEEGIIRQSRQLGDRRVDLVIYGMPAEDRG